MTNKRSDLANILRQLADYVDHHPDEELAPIFKRATLLAGSQKSQFLPAKKFDLKEAERISTKLQCLPDRDAGEALLLAEAPNRRALEVLARFLNLPVQRDDSVEKLRAKIVENIIGSRLRSEAIQGKSD